jgi:hypothetical protein
MDGDGMGLGIKTLREYWSIGTIVSYFEDNLNEFPTL